MKVWEKLIAIEDNEAYDFYDDPRDTLQDYEYAVVDTTNGMILMVDKYIDKLQEEYVNGSIAGFEATDPVILEIETDTFFVPETKTVWTETTDVRIG